MLVSEGLYTQAVLQYLAGMKHLLAEHSGLYHLFVSLFFCLSPSASRAISTLAKPAHQQYSVGGFEHVILLELHFLKWNREIRVTFIIRLS